MELVDRDLSNVKLSITHKRLTELHPADVADILEQLDPKQRSAVFDHLDQQQAAQAFSELEDEFQTDMLDDLGEHKAADLLAQMEPDDAADIIGDLPYEKAEKLLWLMGVSDEKRIRSLLGYKDKTAGGIMTTDFVAIPQDMSVGETIEKIRQLDENHENVHYIYTLDDQEQLRGAFSLRSLVLADNNAQVQTIADTDLITVGPDEDQEDVAESISKYNLLALPVVDETSKIIGIVTIDDAIDVLEEEHSEDLQIAGASSLGRDGESIGIGNVLLWLLRKHMWIIIWAVFAILITMSGYLQEVLPTLIFAPLVLLVATETVGFAMNDLLEYSSASKAPKARRLLGRNLMASLLTALAIGCLSSVLFVAIGGIPDGSAPFSTEHFILQELLFYGLVPAIATALLTILAGTLITLIARRQLEKDKPLSVIPATLVMMTLAFAVQIGLQLLLVIIHPLSLI
jgi:Mg2+ transporter MgtE